MQRPKRHRWRLESVFAMAVLMPLSGCRAKEAFCPANRNVEIQLAAGAAPSELEHLCSFDDDADLRSFAFAARELRLVDPPDWLRANLASAPGDPALMSRIRVEVQPWAPTGVHRIAYSIEYVDGGLLGETRAQGQGEQSVLTLDVAPAPNVTLAELTIDPSGSTVRATYPEGEGVDIGPGPRVLNVHRGAQIDLAAPGSNDGCNWTCTAANGVVDQHAGCAASVIVDGPTRCQLTPEAPAASVHLTLGISGEGAISVYDRPSGPSRTPLACSATDGCDVAPGTTLYLEPVAGARHFFSRWSGPCEALAEPDGSTQVTVSGDASCVASFVEGHELSVEVQAMDGITGARVVAMEGAHLACSDRCNEVLPPGTEVELHASGGSGDDADAFTVEWQGDCTQTRDRVARVSLDGDRSCRAVFRSMADPCQGSPVPPSVNVSVRMTVQGQTFPVTPDAQGRFPVVQGQRLELDASGSTSPTGGSLSFAWFAPGTGAPLGAAPSIAWLVPNAASVGSELVGSVEVSDAQCGYSASTPLRLVIMP